MAKKKQHSHCDTCGVQLENDYDKNGKLIKIRFCSDACVREGWRKMYEYWQSVKERSNEYD